MQIPSFCWNPDCSKGKERSRFLFTPPILKGPRQLAELRKTIKNCTFLPKSMCQKKLSLIQKLCKGWLTPLPPLMDISVTRHFFQLTLSLHVLLGYNIPCEGNIWGLLPCRVGRRANRTDRKAVATPSMIALTEEVALFKI